MAGEAPRRPRAIGVRGGVVLALAGLAAWGYVRLDLRLAGLVPDAGGLEIALEFFARALTPALTSEAEFVPIGAPTLLETALGAAGRTVLFAAAAMSLSLVLGVVLGFFASTAWWSGDPSGGRTALGMLLRRAVAPAVYAATRVLIAFMRSIHEILWAVLFLAAMGLNNLAAVVAIAIPFGGTLAKIFSEMVDEAPRDAADALRGAGASGLQIFWFGLVPRALPDMTAYAFYRFECALRASAVLGFFGFETLGLYLRQSFASANYGEVWTHLYVLIALIIGFDVWSGAVRRRLTGGTIERPVAPAQPVDSGDHGVDGLYRARPRSRLIRVSLLAFGVGLAASWLLGGFEFADAFSERRGDNLAGFFKAVRPFPLQDRIVPETGNVESVPWDWGVAATWAGQLWSEHGASAALATLAISVLSIALAGLGGLALCLPASRTFATPEAFAPAGQVPSLRARFGWHAVVVLTRLLLTVLRAVPEYLWAFLLLAVLGPSAWPIVLALALHNAGILGRLGAEVVENVEPRTLEALRAAGARRRQVAAVGLWPTVLPRFLLYYFYRWETCVREATVLGMLGVVSLGYWVSDARARGNYDAMVFLICVGSAIVITGDALSAVARRAVR